MRFTRAGIWILASVVGLPVAALAQASVSDTTFADANWSLTVFQGGGGGVVTAGQTTVGSDFIRSVSDALNNNSILSSASIYTPFTYNPGASGQITSLSYSENAICLNGCFGQGQSTGPALSQGGVLYAYNGSLITGPSTSFHNLSLSGLTSADFARLINSASPTVFLDNTQHPDFSGSGAPIQFGFLRANSATGPYTLVAGINDWAITINAAPSTVPTLNPFAMGGLVMLLAVAGVLFLRRS